MRKYLLDYDVNLFFKFLFLSIYVVTVDFVFIQNLFSKINLVFFRLFIIVLILSLSLVFVLNQ